MDSLQPVPGTVPGERSISLDELERRTAILSERFEQFLDDEVLGPQVRALNEASEVLGEALTRHRGEQSGEQINFSPEALEEINQALLAVVEAADEIGHRQLRWLITRPMWRLAQVLELDSLETVDTSHHEAHLDYLRLGIEDSMGEPKLAMTHPRRYRRWIDALDEHLATVGNPRTFLEEAYMGDLDWRKESVRELLESADPEDRRSGLGYLVVNERDRAQFYESRFGFERSRGHGDIEDVKRAYEARLAQLETYEEREYPAMRCFPIDTSVIGTLPEETKALMLTFAERAVAYLARRHVWDPAEIFKFNHSAHVSEGLISRVFDTLRYFEEHQDEMFEMEHLGEINDLRVRFFEGGLNYQLRAADVEWRGRGHRADPGQNRIATGIRIRYDRFAESLENEWLRDCTEERGAVREWLKAQRIRTEEGRVKAVRGILPHLRASRNNQMYSPQSFKPLSFWQPRVLVAVDELPTASELAKVPERMEKILGVLERATPRREDRSTQQAAAWNSGLRMAGSIAQIHEFYMGQFEELRSIIQVMGERPLNPFAHVQEHLEVAGRVARSVRGLLSWEGADRAFLDQRLSKTSGTASFADSVVMHVDSQPIRADRDFARCEHWFAQYLARNPVEGERREGLEAVRSGLVNLAVETHGFYNELLRTVHEGVVRSHLFEPGTIRQLEGYMHKAVEGSRYAQRAKMLSDLESFGVRDRTELDELTKGVAQVASYEGDPLAVRLSLGRFLSGRIKSEWPMGREPEDLSSGRTRYLSSMLCSSSVLWESLIPDAKDLRDGAFRRVFSERGLALACLTRKDRVLSTTERLFERFEPGRIVREASEGSGLGKNTVESTLDLGEAIGAVLLSKRHIPEAASKELLRSANEIVVAVSIADNQNQIEPSYQPAERVRNLAENLVRGSVIHLPVVPDDVSKIDMDRATRAARAVGRAERLLFEVLGKNDFDGREDLVRDLDTYWLNVTALAGDGSFERLDRLRRDARNGRE